MMQWSAYFDPICSPFCLADKDMRTEEQLINMVSILSGKQVTFYKSWPPVTDQQLLCICVDIMNLQALQVFALSVMPIIDGTIHAQKACAFVANGGARRGFALPKVTVEYSCFGVSTDKNLMTGPHV